MKLDIAKTNISFNSSSPMMVSTFVKAVEAFKENKPAYMKINYRPAYQRSEAWNTDFKEKLILSILVNYPIGNIILRDLNQKESLDKPTHEIVDGQQRILAIISFLHNEFKLGNEVTKSLLEQKGQLFEYDLNKNYKNSASKIYTKYKENKEQKFKLSFSDLPTELQNQINSYPLTIIMVSSNDDAIAQYFRFIQNQERLRAGEIINSIPDTYLLKYYNLINDREQFLDKINWKESRKEFDKIFYSMIGIFDNKLNFGTIDESIINFVSTCEEISYEAERKTKLMIDSINHIARCNIRNDKKFSKRLIKFLFLSAGFGTVDYINNTEKSFKKLLDIESKLPYFNSGDMVAIKRMFSGASDETISLYNQLFILGRGSHSARKTEEVIKNIKTIMEKE